MVAALGVFVACEKDEFEALDTAFAAEINRLDAADDVLQSNIDDLTSAFNAFVIAINEKVDAAVAALEAADEALEAYINAEITELEGKLDAAVESLTASINDNTDLIKETGKELRAKLAAEAVARAAGDLEIANELADQVGKLEKQDSIAASHINRNLGHIFSLGHAISRESAARVAADADLQSQINTVSSTLITQVSLINDELDLLDSQLEAEETARIAADSGLQGNINANSGLITGLRTELDAAVLAANALTGRVSATEAFGGQISALNILIADIDGEHDGNHATALAAITTAINTLRGQVQTFATNGDTALQASITAEISRIDGLVATLRRNVDNNAANISTLTGAIASLQTRVSAIDFVDTTELATAIDALRTELQGHVSSNAFDPSGLQGQIDILSGRVSTTLAFASQISALETDVAALEGLDVVIGSELVTAIGSLRTELQSYADGAFDPATLQASIDALSTRIDNLPTGGGTVGATYGDWTPAYNDNQADFVQSRSVSVAGIQIGTESRTIVITRTGGVSSTETSDEATQGDQNSDSDSLDTLSRVNVSPFTYTASEGLGSYTDASSGSTGSWTVVTDNTPAPVYVPRTYTDWTPAFGTQTADFTQTRTVSNTGASFDPAIAVEALSRDIVVTRTGGVDAPQTEVESNIGDAPGTDVNSDGDYLDTASRAYTTAAVYTASENLGSHTVAAASGPWRVYDAGNVDPSYDTRSYSDWAPAFGTQTDNFEQTRSLTNPAGNFDPASTAGPLSRNIIVSRISGGVESPENSDEATHGDQNADGDTLDLISRTVTSDAVYQFFADSVMAHTHTVQVAPGSWSVTTDNSAPQDPPAGISGDITIDFQSGGLGVLGFTATYAVTDSSGANVALANNAFSFNAAETYTITVTSSAGVAGTGDIVVDASDDAGTYTVAFAGGVMSITKG